MEEQPAAFMEGSFALYALPDDSLVIAYKRKGNDSSEQFMVPAYVMSMAAKFGGGSDPMAMLAKLGGGM